MLVCWCVSFCAWLQVLFCLFIYSIYLLTFSPYWSRISCLVLVFFSSLSASCYNLCMHLKKTITSSHIGFVWFGSVRFWCVSMEHVHVVLYCTFSFICSMKSMKRLGQTMDRVAPLEIFDQSNRLAWMPSAFPAPQHFDGMLNSNQINWLSHNNIHFQFTYITHVLRYVFNSINKQCFGFLRLKSFFFFVLFKQTIWYSRNRRSDLITCNINLRTL